MGIKRAIAMRCSQQQFDAVKDRIVNSALITNFNSSEYLVNCYKGDLTTNLELEYAKAWTNDIYRET